MDGGVQGGRRVDGAAAGGSRFAGGAQRFRAARRVDGADPETYYITDHYLNYEWVLVRLGRVHPDAMRDLFRGAWRRAAATGRKAPRKRKGSARRR